MRLFPNKDVPENGVKYVILLNDSRIIEGIWNTEESYFEVNCPYIYMEDVKWFMKSNDFINSVNISLEKLEEWESSLNDLEFSVNRKSYVREEIDALINPFYEKKINLYINNIITIFVRCL